MENLFDKIVESTEYIKSKINQTPQIGLILGSGLGVLGDEIENPIKISYDEIPNFPVSTVEGHKGQLVIGKLEGKNVIAMQGRFHYYEGYKNALEEFDYQLGTLMNELNEDDLLIICADHGNDPTFKGTDHTREYVPVIVYSKSLKEPKTMQTLETMADIGLTILDNFSEKNENYDFEIGKSFLEVIK